MMKYLLVLALVTACRAEESNPLGKVIDLMNGLAAKVTAEGEAELKTYKEYVNWCDDAAQNSGFEIKTHERNQAKSEASIADNSAQIEAATSNIESLAAALSENEAELSGATDVDKKETANFQASEKELIEVVDTLGRAISIIEREMQKNPAAFNQIAASAQSLLQTISSISDAASLSNADRQTLVNLVQTQQSDADDAEGAGAPAAAVYKSQSGGIVDLLEDMKDKAESELSKLRKGNMERKHSYNMLKQSLEDAAKADKADKAENAANKAAASERLATDEEELETTKKSLQVAKESLESANTNCMRVAADHEATVASRNEELKVIAEAKKILEDTSGGAVEQTYSFVQIATKSDLAGAEVVSLVKRLANKQHSSALAQLASRISSTFKFAHGDDPFGKVKGLIKTMIDKLEKEADADATEKAWCDEQMADTEEKKADLEATIAKLSSKIDVASAKSTKLKADVKELQANLAKLAKQQAEMDKIRAEESADFKKAKAELELGLSGVRGALSKLREYYGSADSFLQNKPMAELMQQPAMPEGHSKAGGAGGSIIGILEVCESDFAKNLAKEETQESDAAEAYETTTQDNKISKTTMDQDVKYKTQEHKGLDKSIAELSGDRDDQNEELSAVLEYYAKIKDRCIAKPETYEERKARREAEINGLKEALEILKNEGASFIQRKHRLRGAIQA